MKKNPETIADLKFNWVFDGKPFKDSEFKKSNSQIWNLKIKKNRYKFFLNELELEFEIGFKHDRLIDLIDWITYEVKWILFPIYLHGGISWSQSKFELIKFELLSENSFKIYVKKT